MDHSPQKNTSHKNQNRFLAWVDEQWIKWFGPRKKYPKPRNFYEFLDIWLVDRTRLPSFLVGLFLACAKLVTVAVLIAAVSGVGAVIGVAQAYMETKPTLDLNKIYDQDQTSFIYDGNGTFITHFSSIENRIWAPIDEIPKIVQEAFVAIEDMRFYQHAGLDYKRIVGAFIGNFKNNSTQGGSTITSQLIKNTILTDDPTYKRKLQEAYLSLELERSYTKDQILESYLNTIHLGESNYGVKTAAMDYFGKELSDLTLLEAATLAGCTKNPYLYNPRKNFYDTTGKRSEETTYKRAHIVLRVMYENGFIDKAEYEAAMADKLTVVKDSTRQQLYDMPYFIEYALQDVVTAMLHDRNMQNTTTNRSRMENELRTKGYRIYTTVDPDIQHAVEESLYNWENYPQLRNPADQYVTGSDGRRVEQPQAAAAVYDYRNGQLKAIVGGRFSPIQRKELNRAFQAHMPVGSSIKPIAVYGPALDKGASPASIAYNIPMAIDGWAANETAKQFPSNYGGGGFNGAISLREAVKKSLNVVAAQVLMNWVGVEDSYHYLLSMGISEEYIKKDGAGLALGTSGITPVEMAVAYGTLANAGVYQTPLSFTHITDASGRIVLDMRPKTESRAVFKPGTAWMMVDVLTDAVNGGTGSRAKIKGMTVAGKTGTNSDYRGVFFAGMTPYYSAALWVGHDNYKPLYQGAQGGKDAAPLWADFMGRIHENLQDKPIINRDPGTLGLVKATICAVSGELAGSQCGDQTATDWFLIDYIPSTVCRLHTAAEYCTVSNMPSGPYCPESAREMRYALIIPPDHALYKAEDAVLQQFFPGAVRKALISMPAQNQADPSEPITQPENSIPTCTVHTSQQSESIPDEGEIPPELAPSLAEAQAVAVYVVANPETLDELSDVDRVRVQALSKSLLHQLSNHEYETAAQIGDVLITVITEIAPELLESAL